MKTQDNKENKNPVETVVKKPDVKAGLLVQCHVKITDPNSGQILLKTRG
jgi:hypothetical protein